VYTMCRFPFVLLVVESLHEHFILCGIIITSECQYFAFAKQHYHFILQNFNRHFLKNLHGVGILLVYIAHILN
jgi:hypothetical protein